MNTEFVAKFVRGVPDIAIVFGGFIFLVFLLVGKRNKGWSHVLWVAILCMAFCFLQFAAVGAWNSYRNVLSDTIKIDYVESQCKKIGLNIRTTPCDSGEMRMSFSHGENYEGDYVLVRCRAVEIGFDSVREEVVLVYEAPSDIYISEEFVADGLNVTQSLYFNIHVCPQESIGTQWKKDLYNGVDRIYLDSIYLLGSEAPKRTYYYEFIDWSMDYFRVPGKPQPIASKMTIKFVNTFHAEAAYWVWGIFLCVIIVWAVLQIRMPNIAFKVFALSMSILEVSMVLFIIIISV